MNSERQSISKKSDCCVSAGRQTEETAEMAEFGAGSHTRQEERYAILLFLPLLGGKFSRVFL